MATVWLETRVFVDTDRMNDVLMSFVKPLVDMSDRESLFESFHFFEENDRPHILFRVLAEKDKIAGRIRPAIIDRLREMGLADVSRISDICDYHGEQSSFGDEGWKIAQRFFEYGSRVSLLKKDTLGRLRDTSDSQARRQILRSCMVPSKDSKEGQFHEDKFVHCFLNQMGYTRIVDDVFLEAMFHLERFFERMASVGKSLNEAQELLRDRVDGGFGGQFFRR